jgi:hypothetical protein
VHDRALASPDILCPEIIGQRGLAAKDRQFDLRAVLAVDDRDAEFARASGLHRRDGRVELVSCREPRVASPAHDDVDTASQHAQQVGRQDVDGRVPIHVKQRPVRQDHFETSLLGSETVAVKERQVRNRGFGPAVAIDVDLAFDERDVGGRGTARGHGSGLRESHRRRDSQAAEHPQTCSPDVGHGTLGDAPKFQGKVELRVCRQATSVYHRRQRNQLGARDLWRSGP